MVPVFGVISPHPPIMVPGVGGARSSVTADSLSALSRARAALVGFHPEMLIVMSPHAPAFSDAFVVDDSEYFAGDLSQFGDSTTFRWPGDPTFAKELTAELNAAGIPVVARSEAPRLRGEGLDHATIVPLSFLEPTGTVPIVVLSLSFLDYAEHHRVGELVRLCAERLGRRAAFIASGDLSHRLTPDAPAGYSPSATLLDEAIVGCVRSGELGRLADIDPALIEAGGECGLRSFIALAGYCGTPHVPTRVLAYEGPWGVGYLTALVGDAAVKPTPAATQRSHGLKGGMPGQPEAEIVALARHAIELYVRHGEVMATAVLQNSEYAASAGSFVSLHRNNELRGCIGTIVPTRESLALEVTGNAIEAATRDPRFPPLSADELDDLEIKVDVLHEAESCSLADLDPERYGVIVSSGWRRGLLLPALEGVDDVETQVRIALAKAGIGSGEPCAFERFQVDRYT